MKEIYCLESSSFARISNKMHPYNSVELAYMHFMFKAAEVSGSHPTHVQKLSSLFKDYPPTVHNSAYSSAGIFRNFPSVDIMPRSIKRSTREQHSTKRLKYSAVWLIFIRKLLHVHSLSSHSVSLCIPIYEMHVGNFAFFIFLIFQFSQYYSAILNHS